MKRGTSGHIEQSVGIGFDVHKFDDGDRPLMLGGVHIADHLGLVGHSDADVVAHAITDALLGAAALGDIGTHFPDSDDQWKGVAGIELLTATKALLDKQGWNVTNVDCTVITESPKIAPHREEMQMRMGSVIGATVNVKGSRAEGLGAIGRVEGIACYAVALLERS